MDNCKKCKELIVDFSTKQERNYQPLIINGTPVERVYSFQYLGVHITQDLSWSCHVNTLVKKARQCLYHLRRLKDFKLPSKVLKTFNTCSTENILMGSITAWFGNCTKQVRQALQRVVRSAEHTIRAEHPDLESKRSWNKARKIMKDLSHPNNRLFSLAPVEIGLLMVEEVEEGGECTDRERRGKSVGLRIGTLNVGTMTGKGRELADMMERRKVDILCVQETRWKGSKARSIGAGFKLFYYGVDSKRNGVGVVLKGEFVRNVLEVKRVSDRVMSLKLEIEGVMQNVVSGYAPQVGSGLDEKEKFWGELDEVIESIPMGERVVIGADFNGHVGKGNTGDEEVMGKFGVKERNLEGQMVVDFAKRMDMAVVNTYFQKREEHRVTYKSGGRSTQVDYILCRRGNLKEISDCKVVVGESVARQHRMVVCRMTLMVCKKKKRSEIEKKTKWWKLKKEECCAEF
ncbi:hypothetical protein QTP70_003706 [Hemibagrus guttatus]|uniref:Endonuclease/exonuclease/phosphatase domain-containing protein n=1 Tax=Hemibagrus guttatus TaxID=175788 RepID=A0AAE0QF16_9TELE|nr:hypothetical protein QTP70_003706 [Hemibagrus guttatus]KAK3552334.1 hypothetical protein QTP86_010377 [Hemibagrus guttatus]